MATRCSGVMNESGEKNAPCIADRRSEQHRWDLGVDSLDCEIAKEVVVVARLVNTHCYCRSRSAATFEIMGNTSQRSIDPCFEILT